MSRGSLYSVEPQSVCPPSIHDPAPGIPLPALSAFSIAHGIFWTSLHPTNSLPLPTYCQLLSPLSLSPWTEALSVCGLPEHLNVSVCY